MEVSCLRLRYLFLLVVFMAAAACGGSSPSSSSSTPTPAPTPQTIPVTETEFSIAPANLNLKAGTYVFQLQNGGRFPHDLHIVDSSNQPVAGTTAVMPAGGTATFTATLKAGAYTMFCAVDGHRARGMQGTVTVT
jgi:plastocyanin